MADRPPEAPDSRYRPGPHWVALIGTALTWPLLLVGGTVSVAIATVPAAGAQSASEGSQAEPPMTKVSLEVNGTARELEVDTRTTLLDALR